MDFVERARLALNKDCLVNRGVNKDGCKVVMTDAPAPRLIIDFDKSGSPLAQDATRCDFLIIAKNQPSSGWVVPIELKRGQLKASQVVRQLQAGTSAAERLVLGSEPIKFRPVAVSGSISKHERMRLRENQSRIRFHEHREPIRLITCGDPLNQALGL